MTPETFQQLSAFCTLANAEIFQYYGDRGSCIFSTATVCDVLTHFGLQAEPLRVEAALFHDAPKSYGCILGSMGDGTRRPAAGKDKWHGHLVSVINDRYLLDSTLDQANDTSPHLKAKPVVIDLTTTTWFEPDLRGGQCTGLLRLWDDVQIRYSPAWHQTGFRHAGDFRASRRRELVPHLIALASRCFAIKKVKPIFET